MTHHTINAGGGGHLGAAVRSNRRQFLVASSAVAAGALLMSGDFTTRSGLELLRSLEGPRIPVAYVSGSAGAPSLAAALAAGLARAVPAVGLRPSADAGSEALVTFQGFSGGADVDSGGATGFGRVLVDALVPSPVADGQTIPFYAWTYRRQPTPSASVASTLRVPAGRDLRFGVSVAADDGMIPGEASTTVFSSRRSNDVPTLRSGVYLLGLDEAAWSAPVSLPAVGDPAWRTLPSTVMVVEELAGR